MIKAVAGDLLVLILTPENITRMKAGDHVYLELKELGNPKVERIAIAWAADLKKGKALLDPFIGPDTRIHGQEN